MMKMAKKAAKKRKVNAPQIAPPVPQPPINPMGETQQRKIVRSRIADSIYTLSDGTKLVLKPLIADVRRAVGQFNSAGQPVYFLTVANSIETRPPKSLMQKRPPKTKKTKSK
jgi:hypothetical protein